MFWIVLAAASAQLSPPLGTDIRSLFSYDDVPMEYLPAESDRSVGIRLTVRPDGHVQSCDVEYTSGVDGLDVYTCKLRKRRARFAAASAEMGNPSYAVYRATIRWVVTGFAKPSPKPVNTDLVLTVNELPKGAKSPAYVSLMFVVDERGRTSSCSAEKVAPGQYSGDPQLLQMACEEIPKSYRPTPAKDDRGNPVESVQDAIVAFTTE